MHNSKIHCEEEKPWLCFGEELSLLTFFECFMYVKEKGILVLPSISSKYVARASQERVEHKLGQLSEEAGIVRGV